MPRLDTTTDKYIDDFLRDFFAQKIERAAEISPAYKRLWETTEHMVLSGGKRLRPRLTMLAFEHSATDIDGVPRPGLIAVACSQELLHSALLIHDDIIDRDTIRRGQLNINGSYEKIYSTHAARDDLEHYAYSASILAGDLLIAGAHELIAFSDWPESTKNGLQRLLERSIFEVAGGELLDLEAVFMKDDIYDPEIIYRYKTASYSFVYPLLAGTVMAEASEATKEILANYGRELGVAYQLNDDLLGVFGDPKQTGKSTTCDLREAKQTLLVKNFMNLANAQEKKVFNKVFGNKQAKSADLQAARRALKSSGAKQSIEARIRLHTANAREFLANLSDTPAKQKLQNLTETIISK